MSNPTHLRRAGVAALAGLALAAVPAVAQAAPVDLGTAGPFVALGGSTVTNTGPSVLDGELGVSPGTALTGFGLPAVVNGAIHDNDAVAGQAQSDLTVAYDVAAGQPVAPADDLTGSNLGNRTLTAGAYRYSSGALLTGTLTLNAEGDPNAQFVFEIGSALTTSPGSAVALINGASPCNVFWQVGSSATLDTTTAFQGNLMALTSISLNNAASVVGRLLARNGQISLINNVLDNSRCRGGTTPGGGTPGGTPPGGTTPGGGTPGGGTSTGTRTPGSGGGSPAGGPSGGPAISTQNTSLTGRTTISTVSRKGTSTMRRTGRKVCTAGFQATVRGSLIKRVVFRLDGRRIAKRTGSPFSVFVRAIPGRHKVTARVTFRDATRAKTMSMGYRACAAAVLHPRGGPSQFTG